MTLLRDPQIGCTPYQNRTNKAAIFSTMCYSISLLSSNSDVDRCHTKISSQQQIQVGVSSNVRSHLPEKVPQFHVQSSVHTIQNGQNQRLCTDCDSSYLSKGYLVHPLGSEALEFVHENEPEIKHHRFTSQN